MKNGGFNSHRSKDFGYEGVEVGCRCSVIIDLYTVIIELYTVMVNFNTVIIELNTVIVEL